MKFCFVFILFAKFVNCKLLHDFKNLCDTYLFLILNENLNVLSSSLITSKRSKIKNICLVCHWIYDIRSIIPAIG